MMYTTEAGQRITWSNGKVSKSLSGHAVMVPLTRGPYLSVAGPEIRPEDNTRATCIEPIHAMEDGETSFKGPAR